eukprot:TRINITY_DN2812_c0_g2_i1.p1 TRINITY_DN2812_c0_g2~~TRINITY_DN2812_c0_g2_i1.p1  ORF type:complete len:345 (+),score=102.93 TRINITY_DN2812_c0_g2_i1:76-1110(+)
MKARSGRAVSANQILCTFAYTQRNYADQKWYVCGTCQTRGATIGCCEACARLCHAGHNLVEQPATAFYCDCGAGDYPTPCKCTQPVALGASGYVSIDEMKRLSAVQLAPTETVCTFAYTNKQFADQVWYKCRTCNRGDSVGCCVACASVCHAGHQLERAEGAFFCDCGAGEFGQSCQILEPRVVPELELQGLLQNTFVDPFNFTAFYLLNNANQAPEKKTFAVNQLTVLLQRQRDDGSFGFPQISRDLGIDAREVHSKLMAGGLKSLAAEVQDLVWSIVATALVVVVLKAHASLLPQSARLTSCIERAEKYLQDQEDVEPGLCYRLGLGSTWMFFAKKTLNLAL